MGPTFNCSLLTPDRQIFEGEVNSVVVETYNGKTGFLHNHAPYIGELGIGELQLKTDKATEYFVVEGGVIEVRRNNMIILAENAFKKEELDAGELKKQIDKLYSKTEGTSSDEEDLTDDRDIIIRKLKARLGLASR